ALQLSQGDLTALVTRPFALACYVALAVIILLGLWLRRRQSRLERALESALEAETSVSAAVDHMWEAGDRTTDVATAEIEAIRLERAGQVDAAGRITSVKGADREKRAPRRPR
ncbi:MAG: hypothetical protein LH624_03385, partial [Cryobacterium sp.]|nr:hypothetical protein [Cryobacterium sp.]